MQRQSHGLKTLVNQESYKQQNCLSKIETNKIPVSALAWKFSIPLLQEKFWIKIENQYFSWIHQRKESTGQTDSEIQRDRQPQNIADKA